MKQLAGAISDLGLSLFIALVPMLNPLHAAESGADVSIGGKKIQAADFFQKNSFVENLIFR